MYLKSIIAFIVLTAVNKSFLLAQTEVLLYPTKTANITGCAQSEIWGLSAGGRKFVKKVTVPTLSVFLPKHSKSNRSAVIICPGGGYSQLSIEDGGYEVARQLAKEGIVAFVLKYRTKDSVCNSDFSLMPLQDVQQAIALVHQNANNWNIDSTKIGLMGFSAGGHLAALAAAKYQYSQIKNNKYSLRPAFTILVYPVISFMDALTSKHSSSRKNLLGASISEEQKRWFSPELQVNPQTPPSFIIHAANDSTAMVENSISYYNALLKNHVPVKMLLYQKGGHGFAYYNKEENENWIATAVRWLRLNNF